MPTITDQFFSIKEVQAKFKVSRSLIYKKMKAKGIDPLKITCRAVRLSETQVKELFPELLKIS